MSLLLQALQKAAKNREGGGPEQEPEHDAVSHDPGSDDGGPREPELGELPADPDALSLADEEELFEPEPEGAPALMPVQEPAIAPARPPERPVLRPANVTSGSAHAATILRASEARSTGALDWVRDRPVHATLIFAVIFAVFYGAYLFLAINYPAVLRGEFPWSSAPRKMSPKRPISSPVAQRPPEPAAAAASPQAAPGPQAGAGLPGASAAPATVPQDKPLAGLPQAKAASAQDSGITGLPQASTARSAAERPAASEPRERPSRRRAAVEVEATTTALDDNVVVRPPPATAGAPSVTLMQAWQALNQGRFEEARNLYQEVLQAEPQNVDALLGLAAIDTREGNSEQAARHYAHALELEPRNSTAQAGLISLIGQADPRLSETRLKQLIAREPTGFLYFALGNLYARQGQWPQAQPAYFQAYELQPDNPDYAYNLAVGLEHVGQAKIALNYYRRALELSSLRGHAGFDQARVQERIGQLSARVGSQ
jgi:Flp pilus assembly protein TadD